MLHKVPIFAVKSDNLGERGAHRVAYQDFLFEIVLPQDKHIPGADSSAIQCSPEVIKAPSGASAESTTSCFFRRVGYLAAVYVATRLMLALVPGDRLDSLQYC